MSSGNDIDPHESPRALFAFELRQHRTAANLTQRQLAQRMGYSDAMIAMVESTKRPPSQRFAELCDQVFGLDGTMVRLYTATTWNKAPEHLRPWLEEEEDATTLRSWDPAFVPGLLQTETYAREILAISPGITTQELEERLTGRMHRQAILHRDKSPTLTVIMDEAVIRDTIGSPAIMREQLAHLVEMAQHPQVTIQVVPNNARPHCGQVGSFIIAERNGAAYAVYAEAQPFGRTFDDRRLIAELIRRYDAIRANAVPFNQSLRLIEEAVNQVGT
jgi:transcriptional regulator with XRE-family HTH domain